MEGVNIRPGEVVIQGVQVIPLKQIPDDRGTVYHMLKATDPHFLRFGEVYFSTVYPGVVKAWKVHQRVTVNYVCISGRIKLVLYDDRESSETHDVVMEILLGPDLYSLVIIPPGVWNGFQGISPPLAIVANCATEPNDPSELDRLEPGSDQVPYTW